MTPWRAGSRRAGRPTTTGDVWTFKLRQGIKFNDGSPFEAPDVVSTMDRLVDPKSGSAAQAALLGILSVGRHQGGRLVHRRVQPRQAVRRLPVHGVHVVVQHRDAAAQLQGRLGQESRGHGSLAARRSTWPSRSASPSRSPTTGARTRRAASCRTWTRSTGSWSPDESASTLQLQSGAVDVQAQTVFQGAQALWTDPNLRVDIYPSPGIRELQMNTLKEPFTDVRVRQAVASASTVRPSTRRSSTARASSATTPSSRRRPIPTSRRRSRAPRTTRRPSSSSPTPASPTGSTSR